MKSRVSEISVKRIRFNQGVGVFVRIEMIFDPIVALSWFPQPKSGSPETTSMMANYDNVLAIFPVDNLATKQLVYAVYHLYPNSIWGFFSIMACFQFGNDALCHGIPLIGPMAPN